MVLLYIIKIFHTNVTYTTKHTTMEFLYLLIDLNLFINFFINFWSHPTELENTRPSLLKVTFAVIHWNGAMTTNNLHQSENIWSNFQQLVSICRLCCNRKKRGLLLLPIPQLWTSSTCRHCKVTLWINRHYVTFTIMIDNIFL